MKQKIVLIAIFLIVAVSVFSLFRSLVFTKKYNLILISFDGLQAKHLKSYGYPLDAVPNLDAFLKKSSLFTNTLSPSSWTVPTHMSIFTSMYPSEHKVVNKFSDFDMKTQKGVISNLKQLSPGAVTLAEVMKKNGYVTGGFTGDAGVGKQFGFSQGFDTYYDAETFGGFDGSTPRALDWLRKNKDTPFFLFLHGYDVHGQHAPKEGFDYRYVQKPYTGIYTGSKIEQGKLREENLTNGYLNLSDQDIAFWRAIYDEKINRMDLEFKGFMDEVQKMGLMDNTLIVVFSDHGTEFFEHKGIDHGATLYSELINVLFAIHTPGQTKGQRIDQLVSTIDITPTILSLLGIKHTVPKQIKGIDISPALSNKPVAHTVFSETDYRLYTFKRSIQTTDGWKFISTLENEKKELYNVAQDPSEQNNVVTTNPQKGYELEMQLQKHIDAVSGRRTSAQLGCSPVYGDQCK